MELEQIGLFVCFFPSEGMRDKAVGKRVERMSKFAERAHPCFDAISIQIRFYGLRTPFVTGMAGKNIK